MALTAEQIEQQQKQAEELLFSGPQTLGFAKGLFFGHFNAPLLFPYPRPRRPRSARRPTQAVAEVRRFCRRAHRRRRHRPQRRHPADRSSTASAGSACWA